MREVFGRFEQPHPYILPDTSPQPRVPQHSEPMDSSDDDVEMTDASSGDSDPEWDPENDCYAIPPMDKEQVLLDPLIFRRAIKELKYKPSADLFASATHHQLPRYYSKEDDSRAVSTDALEFPWQAENSPYVNPPWSLISTALRKIHREGVRAMVVTPEWPNAAWYPLLRKMLERSILLDEPIYLSDAGILRPKHRWKTRISILNGVLN